MHSLSISLSLSLSLALRNLFPSLKPAVAANDGIVNDHCAFKALKDDLHVLHQQMKVLDAIGGKVHSLYRKIGDEMPLFLNSLHTLCSTEMKSGIFGDKQKNSKSAVLPKYTLFFVEFEKYQRKLMSIFNVVFYQNLVSQHHDLQAFSDIFKQVLSLFVFIYFHWIFCVEIID